MADHKTPHERENAATRHLRDATERPVPDEPIPVESPGAGNLRRAKERATASDVAAHYDEARDAVTEHLGERPPEER